MTFWRKVPLLKQLKQAFKQQSFVQEGLLYCLAAIEHLGQFDVK
jgi:hypothetical protein